MYSSNNNGKRPSSSLSGDTRKKPRKDDDDESHVDSPSAEKEEGGKAKPTRGSRYALSICIPAPLMNVLPEHVPYVVVSR